MQHITANLRFPLTAISPTFFFYGDYRIYYDRSVMPECDWSFAHDDYEPGDPRYGMAVSLEAAIEQINEIEDELDDSPVRATELA